MSVLSNRLAAAALAVVIASPALAGSAPSEAPDLFASPTASEAVSAAARRPEPAEDRQAIVSLNAEAFGQGSPSALRIQLFPGVVATFTRTDDEPAFGGGSVWTGAAGTDDRATIVFADGGLTGQVSIGERIFKVERVKGRVHRAAEIAVGRLPKEGPVAPAPEVSANDRQDQPAPARVDPDKVTTVTSLFAYTERTAKASGDILGDINLAVALTNQAYRAGDLKIRLKLVGTIAVRDFNETKSTFGKSLEALTAGKGPFAPVARLRDEAKADLVTLLTTSIEFCGLAWYVPTPNYYTAGSGFSVVSRVCIPNHTTAHELGHNMGLLHDRFVHEPGPAADYHYGYVNTRKRVMDVMSYADACAAKNLKCVRRNLFSDPGRIVKHDPFGVGAGNPQAADAARTLDETRFGIASYR